MRLYVGLDVHLATTSMCILDEHGKRVKRETIRGGCLEVVEVLQAWAKQGRIAVCYEASCGYGFLYDLISDVTDLVVVAHPGQLS